MWGWLCAIVKGILAAILGVAAKEIRTEVEKPNTVQDENTPPKLKAAVDADIRARLDRMRSRGGDRP